MDGTVQYSRTQLVSRVAHLQICMLNRLRICTICQRSRTYCMPLCHAHAIMWKSRWYNILKCQKSLSLTIICTCIKSKESLKCHYVKRAAHITLFQKSRSYYIISKEPLKRHYVREANYISICHKNHAHCITWKSRSFAIISK